MGWGDPQGSTESTGRGICSALSAVQSISGPSGQEDGGGSVGLGTAPVQLPPPSPCCMISTICTTLSMCFRAAISPCSISIL